MSRIGSFIIRTIIAGGIVAGATETGWTKGASIAQWVNVDGVATILAEKHDRPIVSLNLTFPAGSYTDPAGKEGLANLTGDMLLRGTRSHSREEIENTLDFLGASLSVSTGFHSFSVEGQVLTRNLAPFVDLIVEILSEPTFPDTELAKLKEETIAQLHLRLEDDASLARLNFTKALYSGHPYARDPAGTPETIRNITAADIGATYRSHLHRGGLLIGGAGDLTRPELDGIVRRVIAPLRSADRDPLVTPFLGKIEGREVILVDKPERTQTQFVIGQPGIEAGHKDFFKLNIFMTAFAGHLFQAKYMQEIRVKRGWSYGAYGSVDARRDGGSFYLYTFPKNSDTIPAIRLSMELLEQAIGGDVTNETIDFAKKNVVRSFPFQIDTPEKVVAQRIYGRLMGRSDDYLEKFVSAIEAVTPDEARRAAREHMNTKNLKIVVLCTAKEFEGTIGKELDAGSVRVVPYDRL